MKEPRVSQLMPYGKDSAKSFYGKALLIEDDKYILLQSYDTIVAMYNKDTQIVTIKGWYSMTTGRHLRSFLEFLGMNTQKALKKLKCRSFKSFVLNFDDVSLDCWRD